MVRLGELMMILELHRQGVSITAIARRTGRDPKTIRKYIERGIEAPAYGPRRVGRPSKLAAYLDFLRERVTAFPDLSAARLARETSRARLCRCLYHSEAISRRYTSAEWPPVALLMHRTERHLARIAYALEAMAPLSGEIRKALRRTCTAPLELNEKQR